MPIECCSKLSAILGICYILFALVVVYLLLVAHSTCKYFNYYSFFFLFIVRIHISKLGLLISHLCTSISAYVFYFCFKEGFDYFCGIVVFGFV